MSETPVKPFVSDKPTVSRKFWIVLWVTCAVFILLELVVARHEHFIGFYVLLGFIACSGLILLAKGLGLFLKAKEDYYDDTP